MQNGLASLATLAASQAKRALTSAGSTLSLAVLGYASFSSPTAMAANLVTNGGV